jgi:hypothetical protein
MTPSKRTKRPRRRPAISHIALIDTLSPGSQHKMLATSPLVWQNKARALIRVANHAYRPFARAVAHRRPSRTQLQIILMLYGLALENLLKGLLIAQGQDLIDRNGRLIPRFGKHALERFLRDTGVSVTADELKLVRQLERAVVEGKYPIPIAPKASLSEMSWTFGLPGDQLGICRILTKVEDGIRERVRGMSRRRNLSKL